MEEKLAHLTIADAARLIASRKLSPVELTQALLSRIAALDGALNAFVTVTAEHALARAREAESEIAAGRYRGALHGVPFALKDVYNTAGILTSAHSRVCAGNIPAEDATAVRKLHRAGGVLLGKLATYEFATSGPMFDLPWPPARNPWRLDHVTGGSSSGPAAAVAAGLVPGALGTDTGGSIRIPACFCGVAGLKPTYGAVSRCGVIPNSYSLDHCGPMAWTVEDCAILLQAIAGYDPKDPASADRPVPDYRAALTGDIRGLRVGVIRHFWEEDMAPGDEQCRAMEEALKVLAQLGARIGTARMRPLREYFDVRLVISETELFAVHQHDLACRPQDFGREFLTRASACAYQAVDYVRAQRERGRMLADMRALYDRYDVLVTAGSGPAPRVDTPHRGENWKQANAYSYTPFNVTGGPALALCIGYTASGLPLGMQLAGRPFDDATVLRVGHAYECATPWRARRPRVSGKKSTLWPDVGPPRHVAIDPATRAHADLLARKAGVRLEGDALASYHFAMPAALAIAARLPRDHGYEDPPASVFRFPADA